MTNFLINIALFVGAWWVLDTIEWYLGKEMARISAVIMFAAAVLTIFWR